MGHVLVNRVELGESVMFLRYLVFIGMALTVGGTASVCCAADDTAMSKELQLLNLEKKLAMLNTRMAESNGQFLAIKSDLAKKIDRMERLEKSLDLAAMAVSFAKEMKAAKSVVTLSDAAKLIEDKAIDQIISVLGVTEPSFWIEFESRALNWYTQGQFTSGLDEFRKVTKNVEQARIDCGAVFVRQINEVRDKIAKLKAPSPTLAFLRTRQAARPDGSVYGAMDFAVTNAHVIAEKLFEKLQVGNTSQARLSLQAYSGDEGKPLFGFAVDRRSELANFSHILDVGDPVPSSIFVILTDTKTGDQWQSFTLKLK